MRRLKFIFIVVVVFGGISLTSLPAQATSASAGCNGGAIRPGASCSNPLYVCKGIGSGSSATYSCVCRWGDFESIDLNLVPGLTGTSICDALSGSGSTSRGSVLYIINYFIIMLVALVIMAAMISIVIGGYIYMTAGGSADRVSLAKKWIASAILGIVIALSAWIVLGVINPFLLGG